MGKMGVYGVFAVGTMFFHEKGEEKAGGVHGHFTDKGCAVYSGTICRGLCIDQAADRADQWEYRDIDREKCSCLDGSLCRWDWLEGCIFGISCCFCVGGEDSDGNGDGIV